MEFNSGFKGLKVYSKLLVKEAKAKLKGP